MKKFEALPCIIILAFWVVSMSACMSQHHKGDDLKETAIPQKNVRIEELLKEADSFFQQQQYNNPEGKNAYELYRKVLELEPANEYARKKISDILKILLTIYKGYLKQYEKLRDNEIQGQDVRNEIILILTKMIDTLKSAKKICEDSKDSDFKKRVQELGELIDKYEAYKTVINRN